MNKKELNERDTCPKFITPAITRRAKIARYGLNVADINGLITAAVGGQAATQVVQGEKPSDRLEI